MRITKRRFLYTYIIIIAILAVGRKLYLISLPESPLSQPESPLNPPEGGLVADAKDSSERKVPLQGDLEGFWGDLEGYPHRILGVADCFKAFPDSQDTQLRSAVHHGVRRVRNAADAETRKKELVYLGASPYYHIAKLDHSIPYLVPLAAEMLNDIGRAFFDSLQAKGIPLHKVVVTSVLRSDDDVRRLRRTNGNATENSCHCYGTTIDISYNKFMTVSDPDGPQRREVRNDTLKHVLCEVMRDMRERGRCYVKYEKKQKCLHMTVR